MAPRIPLPSPEEMNEAQKAVYEKIVGGPRGTLVGPLRAALHNPALADRWQALGQVLRYETCLPPDLNELAILLSARHWNSELEWTIHAGAARKAGLDEKVIEAIRVGQPPDFKDERAREVYEFSRQLLENGKVDDVAYAAVLDRWDAVGTVELTALLGYYSMVAMTLNVHRIPLPDHIPAELNSDPPYRTSLPVSPRRTAAE
ncbi:carboxymuconolactone decarboxylase family protein [Rhodobacterales bacterium HKCCE4037]|nr:carboxymuconolactone decarboxylase family protein [Rhodobacterales bacterium HKCCE4037]